MTYCITYILSCITKHSPQYKVLMIGRVLGGIATSLLFSSFESWLVAEHNKVRLQLFSGSCSGIILVVLSWQFLIVDVLFIKYSLALTIMNT